MKIRVTDIGYKALCESVKWCGLDLYTGREVKLGSALDRQWAMKGQRGVVRRVYVNKFWHYTSVWVSVYFSFFRKTVWIEADALDFDLSEWGWYTCS